MFERLFNRLPTTVEEPWFPQAAALDLEEEAQGYRVCVDLPGFDPEDLTVEVTERSLLIRACHRCPDAASLGDERMLARRVELPGAVAVDLVTATYHLGQLEVVLPRKQAVPPRKVPVTV